MNDKERRIKEIEEAMVAPDFWSDKEMAQTLIKELDSLKIESSGYDLNSAIITIFAGAGGDDAEDFARILLEMYLKFFKKNNWEYAVLHENKNDRGGFRNITVELNSKKTYGILKNESGVHRLVRISPFNAKKLRHTSFAMVEVIPKFEKGQHEEVPESEIEFELSRSSGPGGQNVNKRETAVRAVHKPTGLSVHVETERSQAQNKEKAISMLEAKLYKTREEERIAKEKGMYVSKTTKIEWGNQIRSYVLHPYKMVKDHRTGVEVRDVDKVLEGEIEEFLEAEKTL